MADTPIKVSRRVTRDLVCESFADGFEVGGEGCVVTLIFSSEEDAERARFLIKNAVELEIPIRIGVKGK